MSININEVTESLEGIVFNDTVHGGARILFF